MEKRVSYLWTLGAGLLLVVLNLLLFLFRVGDMNREAPLADYLIIFLAGAAIGAALVYFLRRSQNKSVFNATLAAFVISLPFAMFGIIFGGIVGGFGIFLLGVSPAVFLIGLGYYLGRAFAGK